MARRLKAMGQPNYANGFRLTLHEHVLETPLSLKKPRVIFVNSMSDLFHKGVPTDFIRRVFDVMNRADWHTYQILTKRAARLVALSPHLPWAHHIWMGVTVESADYVDRIDLLRETAGVVKFVSLEPLLGPLAELDLRGIDWVIAGGESGPSARRVKKEWVREIRKQCVAAHVPFFFKQWGGVNKKKAGRILDGRTWDQMPRSLAPAV
jgi:protein gp37